MERLSGRTLYHLHTLGAAGAPSTNDDVFGAAPTGHGLDGLQLWLDHVAALGCGGVLLTPIFVSSSHGYDTVDALRIDQRLGDEAAFDRFVDACRHRDLEVVLDGVFNHVGRAFPRFTDVVENGRGSPFRDWFHLDFERDDGDGFGYRMFEGHPSLVTLNHDNPEVLDWCVEVATAWLARGAAGWRFDAAYAMPRAFLGQLSQRIREAFPDAFLFGEMIHGDYAAFVRDAGLDSVTQYELHKAIWSSLRDRNFFELAWALRRHEEFASAFPPVTFAGNHDVTRLASQLTELGHVAHAATVVATVPGLPCVYYGDEFGWTGIKEHREGGDDAIRPPLPDRAEPGTPEQAVAYEIHRTLAGVRRDRPWLTSGRLAVGEVANERLTYTVEGAGRVIEVVLDLRDLSPPEPAPGWTPVAQFAGCGVFERHASLTA